MRSTLPPPPRPIVNGLRRGLSLVLLLALALGLSQAFGAPETESELSAPTGLEVASAASGAVKLTWDQPADAEISGYQVLRRDLEVHAPGEFPVIAENTGSAETSYTDTTVEAGQSYVYRVKAWRGAELSAWSSYARADTPASVVENQTSATDEDASAEEEEESDQTPAAPPEEPSGLSVSVTDGVGAVLSWNDPADASISGYEILRRDRSVDGTGVFHTIESDTGSNAIGYTDATIAAGGSYVYRIKAINAHGSSVWSRHARADVPDDYAPPADETTDDDSSDDDTSDDDTTDDDTTDDDTTDDDTSDDDTTDDDTTDDDTTDDDTTDDDTTDDDSTTTIRPTTIRPTTTRPTTIRLTMIRLTMIRPTTIRPTTTRPTTIRPTTIRPTTIRPTTMRR